MSKKMLVNATQPEENRVAIVVDGILTELDIEVVGREQTRGNIYKATVVRVEIGLQAAFIDYGGQRLGFLQMGEIHPTYFKAADPEGERKGRLRINDVLRRGQEILVQVVKGERGTKGAALTTFLSLAGRYMVLMPESDSTGVSRKIEEESVRKKLKATMKSLDLPANMGYIVRTAGVDQSKEELKRDFDYLVRVYENILALSKKAKSPALIYKESNLVIRSIRDYFTPDIDEVLVDDPKVAQEAKDFLQQVMPECVRLVKLHQEKRPIFSRYQIEEQIEIISRNKVLLPSGGSIVIDRTEALVAIDVNSGKMAGEQGVEATAYKTNLEAAVEVARQLRLRDLGGLIVIDFIDMRDRKNGRDVEKALKDAMKHDKAKVSFGKISSFGLLEMSRQRIKDALAEGTFLVCPHCEGSGRLKSPEAQAVAALRKIQAGLAKGQIARVEVDIPLDAASYLLNAMRNELRDMELLNHVEIMVRGRVDMMSSQVEILCIRREKEDELYLQPVTAVNDEIQPPFLAATAPQTVQPVIEIARADESLAEASALPEKKRRGGRKKKVEETSLPDELLTVTDEPQEERFAASESAEIILSENSDEDETDEREETVDEQVATETETGRKKRKRRRRKKKPASSETASVATETTNEELSPAEPNVEVVSPPDEDGEPSLAVIDGTIESPAKKKRKRRRKKKGTATNTEILPTQQDAGIEDEASSPEDEEKTGDEEGTTPDSAEESTTIESTAKKRRKRRHKKKSSSGEEIKSDGEIFETSWATTTATESQPVTPTPPPTLVVEIIEPAELPAKRPAARRRKTALIPDPAVELPPTLTVEAPLEVKAKKTRSTAKKKTEPVVPESAAEVTTTQITAEAVPNSVTKGKQPRQTKKKTADVVKSETVEELSSTSPPKKTRAPRKKMSDPTDSLNSGEPISFSKEGE